MRTGIILSSIKIDILCACMTGWWGMGKGETGIRISRLHFSNQYGDLSLSLFIDGNVESQDVHESQGNGTPNALQLVQ